MKSFEPLLREIREQMERGEHWQLPVDRIPELLDIDHAEFYQSVYAAADGCANTIDHSTLTRTFTSDSVGELVDLLELFGRHQAEDALADLGVFLPHPMRVELTSVLFETARSTAREHQVDREVFRSMLGTLRSYESARDTYFGEYFSRDRLIREAAERFVLERSFRAPHLAHRSAVDVLTRMFQSHILELQTLLVSVGLALFHLAVETGYARSYEEEAAADQEERHCDEDADNDKGGWTSDDVHTADMHRRIRWACRVLELHPETTDISTVKRAYKRLMLRYHPDVNPRGLNRAKEINRAYSLLLETM